MSGTVLFCPFCREAFEDATMCPDHDIRLVPFDALEGATEPDAPEDDEALPIYDPRLGRGLVGAGAFLLLIASALPFVARSSGDQSIAPSLFTLASEEATALWTVPCVALALLVMLACLRAPRTMRRLRPVVMLAALAAPLSVAIAFMNIQSAALALTQRGEDVHLSTGAGVLAIGVGAVVTLVGALAFGRVRGGRRPSE
jgi:hypothetical protein